MRTGGANALSLETHVLRGTFKTARHGHLLEPKAAPLPVSADDRQRTLEGLRGTALEVAERCWLPMATGRRCRW